MDRGSLVFEDVTDIKIFKASCNGVFGEFLQGIGTDERAFLVTSPINVYSEVNFVFDPMINGIQVSNRAKYKSQLLVNKIFEEHDLQRGGILSIQTHFPIGKGLGSSSADLVASAKVLSEVFALNLTPEMIEEMMRGIEPSDGVMHPGIVSYYYREVRLKKSLGHLRGILIVAVDEGGEVDTVQYNQIKRTYTQKMKEEYDNLHDMVEAAIRKNDIALLGHVATQSSKLNQQFNPKSLLDIFLELVDELSLPGIIVAHSGTYLGFMIDMQSNTFHHQLSNLKKVLDNMGHLYEYFYML